MWFWQQPVAPADRRQLLPAAACLAMLLTPAIGSAELIPLRTGPVSMLFDTENAFLRYVRMGPHEVLRGINAPIRNRFWGTVPPQVNNVQLSRTADAFELTFEMEDQRNWTDASFKTYCTPTVGWQGVLAASQAPRPHAAFPAQPGEVYALYHLLRDVGAFAGSDVREVHSSDTLSAVGVTLVKEGRRRTLVANLTDRPQHLAIYGLSNPVSVYRLDSSNLQTVRQDPEGFAARPAEQATSDGERLSLTLPAYGIARIDQE